jgi:hypothetical protein
VLFRYPLLKNNVFGLKKNLFLDDGAIENLCVGGGSACLQAFDCWWVIMYDPKQVFMAGKT